MISFSAVVTQPREKHFEAVLKRFYGRSSTENKSFNFLYYCFQCSPSTHIGMVVSE